MTQQEELRRGGVLRPASVGTVNGPFRRSWTTTDSIVYALGVGAGAEELEFTTENSEGRPQQALPTMAVVLDTDVLATMHLAGDFDVSQVLHAAQDVVLHRPLPVAGTLRSEVEVVGVHDKGQHALLVCRSTAIDEEAGDLLYTTTWTAFVRDAGGFGQSVGLAPPSPNDVPDRDPDQRVTYQTAVSQGLIYRLSGDRHRLHSDPAYAARLGYERPILHGLCTYGFTGRALLQGLCGGDPGRFGAMHARFAAPVFPGEELTVEIWQDAGGSWTFQTLGADGRAVLSAGRFTTA